MTKTVARPAKTQAAEPTLPTQYEIAERARAWIRRRRGAWETTELVERLDYEHARFVLNRTDLTPAAWEALRKPHTRAALLDRMRGYMPFALEKARERDAVSAASSVAHYAAWTWLAGDAELAAYVEAHAHDGDYGAAVLARVCEHYGWPADARKKSGD